jgi:hypothetical protein
LEEVPAATTVKVPVRATVIPAELSLRVTFDNAAVS